MMKYKSINHLSERAAEMIRFRLNDDLCDVTITAGEGKIRAHKLVLAASSPYFETMFTGDFPESNQSEVTIREVDPEAMETLIEFCYTATVKIDESNVQSLLPAACLLQLAEIQVKSGNSVSRLSNNGDDV